MTTAPLGEYAALAEQAFTDRQKANERYQQALKDSQLAAHRELVFTAATEDITHVSLEPSDQGDYMTVEALDVDDDTMEALDGAAADLPDTIHSYWATLPGVTYESSRRNGDRATVDIKAAAEALIAATPETEVEKPRPVLPDDIGELVAVIDGIVEAWDGGDLAGAVNAARETADQYRTA